ncbi:hypothetical protein B2A_15931 [mine drainage metagenome]|uniref:Uncharacterized protein n=1 Tax=mine drainage metagenome TaxID=410659 RepID=T0Z9K7_9ZZZZ
MSLSIVAFRLPKGTDTNTLTKFVRGLYGQDSKSWNGKYEFHRKGIMEEIPFRKFIRGVIIIRDHDLEKIKSYLARYKAEYYIGTIIKAQESDTDVGVP